jgi:hypothetical protein
MYSVKGGRKTIEGDLYRKKGNRKEKKRKEKKKIGTRKLLKCI